MSSNNGLNPVCSALICGRQAGAGLGERQVIKTRREYQSWESNYYMVFTIHVDTLHATRVQVDDPLAAEDIWFDAYTDGRTWNGWACPFFTREQGHILVTWLNQQSACPIATYDAEADTFTVAWDANEERSVYQGVDAQLGDLPLRLYPIGTWGICWVEENASSTSGELT